VVPAGRRKIRILDTAHDNVLMQCNNYVQPG
jgi:hypothetical protein